MNSLCVIKELNQSCKTMNLVGKVERFYATTSMHEALLMFDPNSQVFHNHRANPKSFVSLKSMLAEFEI